MGVRTRRARKHARTHIVGFGAAGLLGFAALFMLVGFFSLWTLVDTWLQDLPDYTSADAYLVAEPTEVYAADGTVIADFYIQNRKSVTLDEISPYVQKGTVDTEDIRFYQHNGVDIQGILRAVVVQITGGSEGASTITQQLVRNTVLSDEQFDKNLKRKVREAYIAIQMEKVYTKDQILNMYLNTIYYGHGAYGIEAAARTYFNTTAKDLTLAQAATLIGIPNSPTLYDPINNPDASRSRRNLVLDRMLSAGDISQEEHDAAQAEDIVINQGSNVTDESTTYPYFTSYIKQLLLEDFDSSTVEQGGLKVYTTLDPDKQKAAEEAANEMLDRYDNDKLETALVAINNDNGYIEAMVGGKDYNQNQFNLATQAARQPGSSFKTFTLATAISQGMNPTVRINANSPLKVSPTWAPQNNDNYSWGTISLTRATQVSSNTAYAQVSEVVGPSNIVATARALGIDVELPAYESITLGVVGVPVIQMAEAYSTLAAGGIHHGAVAITKIEDRNGNTVYEHKADDTQAIDASVARATTEVLETVVTGGTATNVAAYAPDVKSPIAGKTGTTENTRDLWFAGYTPQTTIACWSGYREEDSVKVWGRYAHPSDTSCIVAGLYLEKTLAGVAKEDFPEADEPTYKPNSSWTFSATSASTNSGSSKSSSKSSSTSDKNTEEQSTSTTETTENTDTNERSTEQDTQERTDTTNTGGGTSNETNESNNNAEGNNTSNSGADAGADNAA